MATRRIIIALFLTAALARRDASLDQHPHVHRIPLRARHKLTHVTRARVRAAVLGANRRALARSQRNQHRNASVETSDAPRPTVATLQDYASLQFVGNISVGTGTCAGAGAGQVDGGRCAQNFQVVFDTGSADTWVVGLHCKSSNGSACGGGGYRRASLTSQERWGGRARHG